MAAAGSAMKTEVKHEVESGDRGTDRPATVGKKPADSAKKELDGEESEDPRRKFDPKAPKKYKAWDKDEMMLLRKGVQKHGVGSWETIRQDPEFKLLQLRTGVQIKDKWRNLVKFRHLTEDEKEAVANRTTKLNKRSTGRSNSFTLAGSAPKQLPAQASSPSSQTIVQPGKVPAQGASMGDVPNKEGPGQSERMQGLQAYSKAHQDLLQAEQDAQQAQATYDQSSLQLNEAVDRNKRSAIQEDVEGLVSAANQAMRQLVLCKHRLSLARDIETRLMKTLQFQAGHNKEAIHTNAPASGGMQVMQENSLDAGAIGCGEALRPQLRLNLAVVTGRSQSYDAKSFAKLYDFTDGKLNMSPEDPLAQPGMMKAARNYSGNLPMPVHTSSGTRSPRTSNCGSMPNSPLSRFRGTNTGRASPLVRSFNLRDLSADEYSGRCDPSSALRHISQQIETPTEQQRLSTQSNSGGSSSTPMGALYGGMNVSDYRMPHGNHQSGYFSNFNSHNNSGHGYDRQGYMEVTSESHDMSYSMAGMSGGIGQYSNDMNMAAAYGVEPGPDFFNPSVPDWAAAGSGSMFAAGMDTAMSGNGDSLFDCMDMIAGENLPGSGDANDMFGAGDFLDGIGATSA